MATRVETISLPLGGLLDKYLARGFLRVFFISLLCATLLYLTVDFFDRVSAFLDSGVPVGTVVLYFFYKTPLLVSRTFGFATLFSVLFCLGMLARTHELTAMRTSGISVQRIALPLVILSGIICLCVFFWNEGLVPIFNHQAQTIYKTQVKNKRPKNLLGTADLWLRGESSFINVDHFDANTNTLQGVTIFLLNRDFSLRGLIEIPAAEWNGRGWNIGEVTEWRLLPDGRVASQKPLTTPHIAETPEEFKLLAREPEEFGFFELQKQISDMRSKGIDTTAYEVDLQTKLALPLISPLMVLIAIPFALRRHMSGSMALSFGIAMLIGFGYWVLTAFCVSLGYSGALPPLAAAWLPTVTFSMVGLFFFTAEE